MNPIPLNTLYYNTSSKSKMFKVKKILPACSLLDSIYEQIVYSYSEFLSFLNSYKNSLNQIQVYL